MRWCERGDLNPHGFPRDPKSRASASSATLAPRIRSFYRSAASLSTRSTTPGALSTGSSLLLVLASGTSWGYRDYFTLEQKAQLAKVQTVLVEVTALTDNGAVDSSAISEVAIRRMKELGYNVVTDPAQPHDVVFKVKCEQRKTWEGTTTMGSDADLPDSPSRVWKGPACQLNYVVGGTKIKWQKEVRTDFLDAVEAAQKANAGDPGLYAMAKLKDRLQDYDFPVLLTADWGQADRLLKVLDAPGTSELRKLKIISLLGEMLADEALPRLQ